MKMTRLIEKSHSEYSLSRAILLLVMSMVGVMSSNISLAGQIICYGTVSGLNDSGERITVGVVSGAVSVPDEWILMRRPSGRAYIANSAVEYAFNAVLDKYHAEFLPKAKDYSTGLAAYECPGSKGNFTQENIEKVKEEIQKSANYGKWIRTIEADKIIPKKAGSWLNSKYYLFCYAKFSQGEPIVINEPRLISLSQLSELAPAVSTDSGTEISDRKIQRIFQATAIRKANESYGFTIPNDSQHQTDFYPFGQFGGQCGLLPSPDYEKTTQSRLREGVDRLQIAKRSFVIALDLGEKAPEAKKPASLSVTLTSGPDEKDAKAEKARRKEEADYAAKQKAIAAKEKAARDAEIAKGKAESAKAAAEGKRREEQRLIDCHGSLEAAKKAKVNCQ